MRITPGTKASSTSPLLLGSLALLAAASLATGCRREARDDDKEDMKWVGKSDGDRDDDRVSKDDDDRTSEAGKPRRIDSSRGDAPRRRDDRAESDQQQGQDRAEDRLERPRTEEPRDRETSRQPLRAAAGTSISAALTSSVSSETAVVGQAVQATLSRDITDVSGRVALPAGTRLSGRVSEVQSARKVKKKSILALHFDSATLPDGTNVAVSTGFRAEGTGYTKKDGAIIGGSAAGGAILGQVLGGDSDSTAVGAVIGGAIGTGVAMGKKGEDITLPAGTTLDLTLDTDVVVGRS